MGTLLSSMETEVLKMIRQWLEDGEQLMGKLLCLLDNKKEEIQKKDSLEILEWRTLKDIDKLLD